MSTDIHDSSSRIGSVAAVTVALWFAFPDNPLSLFQLSQLRNANGWWGVLVFFSNVTLFGTDVLTLFPINTWPQYWAVWPIWSIGSEIWFYLLVPVLVPARLRTLVALICAGVVLRAIFLWAELPFHPWQQRVFPAELPFFLVGILSHRLYRWSYSRGLFGPITGWAALVFTVVFLSMGVSLRLVPRPLQESLYNSAAYAIVLFLLIPPIFNLTRRSGLDRFVGEFSYPIYLWHITIGFYFIPAQELWQGYFLLLLSALASLPLVIWIERPMDRWRRSSLERAKHNLPPSIGTQGPKITAGSLASQPRRVVPQ